jgi:hypothetical protein
MNPPRSLGLEDWAPLAFEACRMESRIQPVWILRRGYGAETVPEPMLSTRLGAATTELWIPGEPITLPEVSSEETITRICP